LKRNYKLKPKLSLRLKEKKRKEKTINKGYATQQKITKNISTRRQCIKLRCGPIDSWHGWQEPGPPVNVVNGV
jgi:hypothetical protein